MRLKYGFTLIELLVSIMLFGLIAAFLYGGIDQIRLIRSFYGTKGEKFETHERLRALLYRDLAQSDNVIISDVDTDHNIITLQADRHSLYNIALTNIVWVVRRDNTLVRLESAGTIHLPIDPVKFYGIHSDKVATDCQTFRVYESTTGRFATLVCANEVIMVEVPH
ncbi:MAG: prepilin-type N-terminal cleavage/methylation domain-containing protein [Sulfuricurvum sp.]|nr:prepilin-type N-terminal cleavage/methylation domain-containing protein [Sulfuricurvum sp.]